MAKVIPEPSSRSGVVKPRPRKRATQRQRLRKKLLERDGNRCHWCGKPFEDADKVGPTIEHRIERRRGGTDDLSNLVLAHSRCNYRRDRGRPTKRAARAVIEWMAGWRR